MYNGGITGGAINTGVPAALVAVAGTGHGDAAGGLALAAVAALNMLLVVRAVRQRPRTYEA